MACLLGLFSVANASAATNTEPLLFGNGKIMPGNHRPVYTQYGHHGLSRSRLFNLFRPNGSGIPKKTRPAHAHRGTL